MLACSVAVAVVVKDTVASVKPKTRTAADEYVRITFIAAAEVL